MKIWCLFSVARDFDQPDNNLVAWWAEKPSLETLFQALEIKMGESDEQTVAVVKVWTGEPAEIGWSKTQYRLEETEDGVLSPRR